MNINLINYLLKFSLYYNLQQTKREMLAEFRQDLQKEKSSQNPVTIRTYEDLTEIDKAIMNQFMKHYRESDNAVYLGRILGYSPDSIKYHIKYIANRLKNNIKIDSESVKMG